MKDLDDKMIVSVAVGESYSLALSAEGIIYSWGSNQYGQLGRSDGDSHVPRCVALPV